ncbi:hypothetical protein [Nocardia ignorata]|uniref:Zinc ribbon protein n=1 Tax=Nocardia ignorata TaxID=145285 RepID=A0A4R6P1B7_NOCIG|nr:hypothetical protein [Nocardia ignorata]TDP31474.1 hypothetical protein DFR75_10879 [Nocardia ignorata]
MENVSSVFLIGLVGYAVVCGVLAAAIAGSKGNSGVGYFALGVVSGVIGIVVALVVPGRARTPRGWGRIRCPRCGTEQNVEPGRSEFVCWQCEFDAPLEW